MKDEKRLLHDFSEGIEQAVSRVHELFYIELYYYALNIVHDKYEAENIVNEAFLQTWKQGKTFQSLHNLKLYLKKATENHAFNSLDRMKNEAVHRSNYEVFVETEIDPRPQIELKQIVLAQVYRQIEELPDQCRIVFKLAFLEGLSNEEIAHRLDISVKTVMNQKRIARDKLKKKLPPGLFTSAMVLCAQIAALQMLCERRPI